MQVSATLTAAVLAAGLLAAAGGANGSESLAGPDRHTGVSASAAYVPGEVLVGGRHGRGRVVELAPGQRVDDAVEQFERRRHISYAAPNWIARAALNPLDVGSSLSPGGWVHDQWSFLERPGGIRIRGAWDRLAEAGHPGARGTTIAIVDTGVAYTDAPAHERAPDLGRRRFVAPRDFVDGDSQPLDSNGHGTHVAGTIGARVTLGKRAPSPDFLTGVAYGARLMPVRVLDEQAAGPASRVAAGIRWASRHRADVINLSFQFPAAVSSCDQVPTVCAAVRLAKRRGALVVGAAGNAIGAQNRRGALFPAAAPGVMGVGATTEHGCLAAYSHYGRGVELVAPGGGVPANEGLRRECVQDQRAVMHVTYECYPECGQGGGAGEPFAIRADTGTSMASAHASAVAAMVIQSGATGRKPTPRQVIRRLTCTARSPGARLFYRAGLLDAFRAVRPKFDC